MMRNLFLLSVLLLSVGCSSIRVFADHDSSVDFSNYSTYAFFKPGIEEVEISDLDKRRILGQLRGKWKQKACPFPPPPIY